MPDHILLSCLLCLRSTDRQLVPSPADDDERESRQTQEFVAESDVLLLLLLQVSAGDPVH